MQCREAAFASEDFANVFAILYSRSRLQLDRRPLFA